MGRDAHPPAAAAAAKSLQSCPTLCNPIDGSRPDSPSLGFSRQEHWSGVPLPSPIPLQLPISLTTHWFPIVRLHSVCAVSNRGSHFSAKTLLLILNLLPPLNSALKHFYAPNCIFFFGGGGCGEAANGIVVP